MVKMGKIIIPAVAIVCIAGLEAFAMSQGINGASLATAIGAICAIGGWKLKEIKDKAKEGKK